MKLDPTIRCRQAARLLSERLEAPLPTGQRLQLAGHLMICASCRRADRHFVFLRTALKAMDTVPEAPPEPPSDGPRRGAGRD
jgi:hypothetical protein